VSNEPQSFSKVAERLIGDFRRVPSNEPRKMRRRPTRELTSIIDELMVKHQIGRSSAKPTPPIPTPSTLTPGTG